MDKILFSNSFKNLMVALGAKTSDSGYAVPLINKTSGAPQGYMEMSALAQVLGVFSLDVTNSDVITNGNNATSVGIYHVGGSSLQNFPASSLYGILIVLKRYSDVIQILFDSLSGAIYSRYYHNAWGGWKQVTLTAVS